MKQIETLELTIEGRKVGTATLSLSEEGSRVGLRYQAEISNIDPPWLADALRITCDRFIFIENARKP